MKQLQMVREIIHNHFLNVRNCNNLVQSDDFEIACNLSNTEDMDEILLALGEMNKSRIRQFIENKLGVGTPFEQMGIRKLRDIAKHLKIKQYQYLNKMTLIEEIKNVASRLKENSQRKHLQSQQTE